MRLTDHWRGLKERHGREADERARIVALLAVRDGFIAVMLLVFALALVRPLAGAETMDVAAPDIITLRLDSVEPPALTVRLTVKPPQV